MPCTAPRGYGLWMLSTADGGFVGDCGLTPQLVDGVTELEVGYHVVPALQGVGYATEAAAASRDFARDVLGATRLVALIHPDNRSSQRVAEKIGLHPEKRTAVHGGRDAIIYAARPSTRSRDTGAHAPGDSGRRVPAGLRPDGAGSRKSRPC